MQKGVNTILIITYLQLKFFKVKIVLYLIVKSKIDITNFFFSFLSYLKKAFFNPEKSPSDNRILIKIFMKPVVFDLYNIIVQLFYIKKIKNIKTPNNKSKSDETISIRHNLNELKAKVFTTSRRVEIDYQIATTPWRDVSKEKLLVIGCRNLVELKQATFFGFNWNNIDGADLFSAINLKFQEIF